MTVASVSCAQYRIGAQAGPKDVMKRTAASSIARRDNAVQRKNAVHAFARPSKISSILSTTRNRRSRL
jgi:hypothetical protein